MKYLSPVLQRDLLLKCHAVVMVIAWLGCAGSGIILARYYKVVWSTLIGRDLTLLRSHWPRASQVMLASAVLCH